MIEKKKRGVVSIGSDRERLRICLPSKLRKQLQSQGFPVKKDIYTGMSDTPKNRLRVEQVVEIMNQDLTNSVSAFDPTLEKYLNFLKPKISSNGKVVTLTGKSSMTIHDAWDDWLAVKKTEIEPSTFIAKYTRLYSNLLKPFYDRPITSEVATELVSYLQAKENKSGAKQCLSQLRQAVGLKVDKGEIKFNPFVPFANSIKIPKKSKQVEAEEDRKAFSKEDMETIIKAFYAYPSCIDYAPIVEFLFLTGCRPSEVYSLTWSNVDIFKSIKIKNSLSVVTGEIKTTKTGVSPRFSLEGNDRLNNLLLELKGRKNSEYVFTFKGKRVSHEHLSGRWVGRGEKSLTKYPNIVRKLAKEKRIAQYLKFYATRHTYISLTANKIAEKYPKEQLLSALKLLADSVGNSLEMILEHYLDLSTEVKLPSLD